MRYGLDRLLLQFVKESTVFQRVKKGLFNVVFVRHLIASLDGEFGYFKQTTQFGWLNTFAYFGFTKRKHNIVLVFY